LTISWSNSFGLKLEKFSADLLFSSQKKISQPEKGYRFSLDSFILAAHIKPKGFEKIIDVGCGCGIMPLILAARYPDLRITGIEIQKELYKFARKNILANKLENKIYIIHENIKNIMPSDIKGKADIIISNPPYKKKNSGRLNPDPQKAIARHEITLDIDLLFKCSKRLLNEQGRLYIIFPAQRFSSLIQTMGQYKFVPEFIRFVHIKKNAAAKRVIIRAAKNSGKPCTTAPPFYIYGSDNKYTNDYACLFKP